MITVCIVHQLWLLSAEMKIGVVYSMQSTKIWRFQHSHWMGPWRSIWPLIVYTSGWWYLLIFARYQQWSWMLQRQRQHIFCFKYSQTHRWSTLTEFRFSWRKLWVPLGLLLTPNYIRVFTLKNSERSKRQEPSNSARTWTYHHYCIFGSGSWLVFQPILLLQQCLDDWHTPQDFIYTSNCCIKFSSHSSFWSQPNNFNRLT